MKILLVKPRWFVHGGVYRFLDDVRFTPLHLAILAALSPGHDVTIIDNDWEEIPFNCEFDLVGVTVTTFTSEKAYEIADKFRHLGVRVVFGGAHASLMPEECLLHADSVVVGEAEYVWPQILKDALSNSLKTKYHNPLPVNMNDVPFPQRGLCDRDNRIATVQATRGCTNSCKFCYLPDVPWHEFRKRDIDLVYEELKNLKQKIVFFVDDNMFADQDYVIRLCEKITPLKLIWSIQAPSDIADNDRLLAAMERAGCFHIHIGFQTINPDSLKSADVRQNRIENYRHVVKKLHEHKIFVVGFFVFGFDSDDLRVFEATESAIKEMDLDDVCLYILTPYPGTRFHESFRQEGRLLARDSSNFGWANAVFKPALMTPEELENGVQLLYERLYPRLIIRTALKMISRLPLFLRHPQLFLIVLKALFRRVNISRRPG
ncbi:MAG: radical SAM protein [Candidatus Wallbacteria bacterium]|nr:radical SAM protein [Candidatus Wallbacteria bacterium]